MSYSDIYFSKKDDLKNLNKRTIHGGLINLGAQGGRLVLQLGSTMILARLLTPDDFGLVGMVMVLVQLTVFFRDFGLTQATIQRHEITRQQISNLFWFNATISILLALLAIACTPLIVAFYQEPKLAAIIWIIVIGILIEGFGLQHRALMIRALQFPRLAAAEVGSNLFSVCIAVYMAWAGYGYWALVGQSLSGALFRTVFYFWGSGWMPQLPKKNAGTKPFIVYGGHLFGFNIVNYFSRNADGILIGKFIGADMLGYYNNAYRLLMLPLQQINGPLSQSILPMLSRLQHDPENYRKSYYHSLRIVLFLSFLPVGLLLATVDSVILVMLGPQWTESIPIFQALLPAAYISAMNVVTSWVFVSLGTTDRQFKWALLATPLTVLCMVAGLKYGVIGVAAGISFAYVIIRIPYMLYAYKGTPVRFGAVMRIVAYPLFLSLLLGGAAKILLGRYCADFSPLAHLAIGLVSYVIAYVLIDILLLRSGSVTIQGFKFFIKRNRS